MPTNIVPVSPDEYPKVSSSKPIHLLHYQLATIPQISSEISNISFQRAFRDDSFLINYTLFIATRKVNIPVLQHGCRSIIFKQRLKEELLSKDICYDSYRRGNIKDIDFEELYQSCCLSRNSSIDIHESDFHDFQSATLLKLSSYKFEEDQRSKQIWSKYYNTSEDDVKLFETFMNDKFIPELDKRVHASNQFEKHEFLDVRLSLDQIFDAERYRSSNNCQFRTN